MQLSKEIGSSEKSVSKNVSSNVEPVNVNQRAVKDLARSFKNVSDERWFEASDGYIVKFTSNDIDYRVDYDKKGHWLHTIRTYGENTLPKEIRHLVKSSYYDYAITLVQEIEQPRNTFTYIVHVEGKTDLIKLRISDGEEEEWQKFIKSKFQEASLPLRIGSGKESFANAQD